MSRLMQSSLSPTFSEISSPLNSARSTQSARAAARRVGLETYGSHILQAKRHALVALANKEAQDEMNVMTELDRFDDRLDQTLNVRPQLAVSARISRLAASRPPTTRSKPFPCLRADLSV